MAKIMVVDDEKHITELLFELLSSNGYEVEIANSGEEALEKLKSFMPDLMVLDLMMPGMSGRSLAEKIVQNPDYKSIRIVFLTVAHFLEQGLRQLKEWGVKDYLTKPFDNEDLLKRIAKALE